MCFSLEQDQLPLEWHSFWPAFLTLLPYMQLIDSAHLDYKQLLTLQMLLDPIKLILELEVV